MTHSERTVSKLKCICNVIDYEVKRKRLRNADLYGI